MNSLNSHRSHLLPLLLLGAAGAAQAQSPHFQLYIAFGQSNMEGAVNTPEAQDKVVNPRYLELPAVTCNSNGRSMTQGTWTPAISPTVRCDTKISVVDWFGRTMADSLPTTDTIGLVVVAVGGTKIEGFDLDKYAAYYAAQASWMQQFAANYGGNPYGRLLTVAKQAKQRGVVKGILLHQGESNAGDNAWAGEVKKIYEKLLSDLSLQAKDIPLLAGEVAPKGSASGANSMIDALPNTISTAHVVSAQGLTTTTADGQNVHFDAPSYRTMGKRYAQAMLALLRQQATGIEPAPMAAVGTGVQAWTVYDLKGSPVARFQSAQSGREMGWNQVRRNLPVGIYWLKGNSAVPGVMSVNGR
jgi:hypothetical protein